MSTERLSRMKPVLELRSRMLQAVRKFFIDRDFIEVETPVRLPAPALELHIDAEPSGDEYLRTSPELHMKRLLAGGYERIFQMGPCFRREERGQYHNPEYTMLEWYRTNADYTDMIVDTKALLGFVLEEVLNDTGFVYRGNRIEILPVWECFMVEEVFVKFAGWNPVANFDANRFDVDLVEKVQPNLPVSCPVILKDYPAQTAAFARCKTGPPALSAAADRERAGEPAVAERWELYVGGMELANAFSELTDPAEQRLRFENCATERAKLGKEVYPLDEEFLSALKDGMPQSGGVALGIDRLVMLMTNSESIDEVRAFCV